ncbi:MAG: hypothetical protein EOP83_05640 [Verrucomicrobiaceae bacterium]|nr:MAG: hypothetical protein EOP83_05640 [Verrucomicrobiaceae bacterium]
MSDKLRLEYYVTAEAQKMPRFRIADYVVEKYPHFVKVRGVWHSEICVRLGDWVRKSGGEYGVNYHYAMSEFMFAQHDLCMLFMVRFQGVPVDDIYTR